MIRSGSVVAFVAWLAIACTAIRADELGSEIDLTSFRGMEGDLTSTPDGTPLDDVAWRLLDAPRRFYISGMIGPSFANVVSPGDPSLASDGTIFTAGGALGVAIERNRGWLRFEVEGMGRDTYDRPFSQTPRLDDFTILTNNWSVLNNLWRDVMLTDRFGIYGGGGIGAGGYILGEELGGSTVYAPPGANFAWQFGGGLLWDVTERLTFDVGYRYFHIDTIRQADYVMPNQFSASELMFTLRLYEPFRNWRR